MLNVQDDCSPTHLLILPTMNRLQQSYRSQQLYDQHKKWWSKDLVNTWNTNKIHIKFAFISGNTIIYIIPLSYY